MYEEIFLLDLPPGYDDNDHRFSLLSTRSLVVFMTLVTSGCFLTLGGLTTWHAKLISKGETSIEAHINR
jgi:hypothetical protein